MENREAKQGLVKATQRKLCKHTQTARTTGECVVSRHQKLNSGWSYSMMRGEPVIAGVKG